MRGLLLLMLLGGWLPLAVAGEPVPAADAVEESLLPDAFGKPFTGDLPAMRKRGFVRVLVSPSRTNYFLVGAKKAGFEYELTQAYQNYLNQEKGESRIPTDLVYLPLPFARLLGSLVEGRGDLVAAGMTITPERQRVVDFTEPYITGVKEILVAAADAPPVERVEQLSGQQVYVLRGSSYAQHLRRLNQRLRRDGIAPVRIQEVPLALQTEDLLELVNAGVFDYTFADDHIARLWQEVLPSILLVPDVSINQDGRIAWAVRKGNPELLASLNRFIKGHRKGSLLGNILFKRYYRNTRWITNPVGKRERKRLRQVEALLRKYAGEYGFDWLMIAAVAYQESGLDQSKHNPSGATGIMQIKPATAASKPIGIDHVERLENNIHAGVKYLAYLRDRYFTDPAIAPADRVYFSFAAYNAGPAKVRRMRSLAKKMGLDPNRWFDNVEIAAQKLVGRETVRYVRNILKYYVAYRLLQEQSKQREQEKERLCGDDSPGCR